MKVSSYVMPLAFNALNFLLACSAVNKLPAQVPSHFDLEGNAAGSMDTKMLLAYPLVSLGACILIWVVAKLAVAIKPSLVGPKVGKYYLRENELVVLALCFCGVVFASLLVTLTRGEQPLFMLAEPVILLAGVVNIIRTEFAIRK